MMLHFRVLNSALRGLELKTVATVVSVGRSSENDLALNEGSVSRFHARITLEDGVLTLEDAGSRNRTRVDGAMVEGPVTLQSGAVLTFGEVLVELTVGEEDAAETDTAAAPQDGGGKIVVGKVEQTAPVGSVLEGWLSQQKEAPLPAKVEKERPADNTLWNVLVVVLGLVTTLALGAYFLSRSGGAGVPRKRFGMLLRVGERKVVEVPRGYVRSPQVESPDVLQVERPMKLDRAVLLVGKSEGSTSVRLYGADGTFIVLETKVLPRAREDIEALFAGQLKTPRQRSRLALREMRRGDRLKEKGSLYAALKAYGTALDLLQHYEQTPNTEYLQAKNRYDAAAQELQKRYDELAAQMADLLKEGDKESALECLDRIKELVPDEQDVRWQNADLLFRLIRKIVEADQRRGR